MVLSCQYTQGKSSHSGIWKNKVQQGYWWQGAFVVDESLCYSCVQDSYAEKNKSKGLKRFWDITLKKCYGIRKTLYNKMFWGRNVLCSAVCENWMLPSGTKQSNVRLKSVHITSLVIPNIISSL